MMITQKNVEIQTTFYSDGTLAVRSYLIEDRISRDPKDGPAYEYFDEKGVLRMRQYFVKGQLSRDAADGPAHEEFHENAMPCSRQYLRDGRYFRDPKDGPVIESFDMDGVLKSREYWLNYQRLTDAEVQAILHPTIRKSAPAPVALPEIFVMIDGKKYKVIEQDPDDIDCPEEEVLAGVGRKV